MNDKPKVDATRPEMIRLILTTNPLTGDMQITGPLHMTGLCLKMLASAMNTVLDYKAAQQPPANGDAQPAPPPVIIPARVH